MYAVHFGNVLMDPSSWPLFFKATSRPFGPAAADDEWLQPEEAEEGRAAYRHRVRGKGAWREVSRRAPPLLAILQARLAIIRAHMDILHHTVGMGLYKLLFSLVTLPLT
jgi:hypothetical protein